MNGGDREVGQPKPATASAHPEFVMAWRIASVGGRGTLAEFIAVDADLPRAQRPGHLSVWVILRCEQVSVLLEDALLEDMQAIPA